MNKKQTVPPKEKPKRPENFYFRYRRERMEALAGQPNRDKIVKEEWKNMPVAQKDAENQKAKAQMAKYREELEAWRKANPDAENQSKRERRGAQGDESDGEKKKVERSKGKPMTKPVTKATKDKDAEEEEEVEKVEKGKSKPKGNEKGKGKVEEKPKVEDKSKKNKK